jgi:hypothetical protein
MATCASCGVNDRELNPMVKASKRWAVDFAIRYRSFVIAILAYLFIMNVMSCFFYIPAGLIGRTDFRQLYTAGYMVRSGYAHQIYDSSVENHFQTILAGPLAITLPFNHMAYEALFFAPLSLLGFRSAYLLFFGINLSLIAACYLMLKRHLEALRRIWTWLPEAIFACFYPITAALIQGQDSVLMLFLITAAYCSYQKGREEWCGIFLGLTLFKFQFGIPIALLFLTWKWWRATVGFFATGVVVAVVSAWIAGLSGTKTYLSSLLSMSVKLASTYQQDLYGIHPAGMPNLRGLIAVLAGTHISSPSVQVVTIACSVLLLLLGARSQPSFSLALLVAVLASYHSLIHDTSLLIIPIGLLGSAAILREGPVFECIAVLVGMVLILPTLLIQTPGHPWVFVLPVLALTIACLGRKGAGIAVEQAG